MSLSAGIDLGTQSLKVLIYDAEHRRERACVSAPLSMQSREDGSREQLASDWLIALQTCFAQLPAPLRQAIGVIGVSGQQHGLVALDAAGTVLEPVKLWCDTSTLSQCQEIEARLGGLDGCIAQTGNALRVGYTASKLRWLAQCRPESYARLHSVLLPHDYLNFVLTGERYTEYGDASGTGWFDVRRRTWSVPALRAIDPERELERCLPALRGVDSLLPLSTEAASLLGLSSGVRVSCGGGDNMMAAIGTGNLSPGQLSLSLGTSGTAFTYSDSPVIDPHGGWAAFCSSSGGWLPLICTMNCTLATELLAGLFKRATRELDQMLADTTPGAGGVLCVPFFQGERSPDQPDARAAMVGLDSVNCTEANLLRAGMEGATLSLAAGCALFERAGLRFDRLRVTGGGSRSAIWRQLLADVFALPVEVPRQPEGAAFGAALQAHWALQQAQGDRSGIAELLAPHIGLEPAMACHPQQENVARYQELARRYAAAVEAVIGFTERTRAH